MEEKHKNTMLAKSSEIVISPRENQHFQEIEVSNKQKTRTKTDAKLNVFWDIDFGRILGGFWEGFGMPKSLIFAVFSMFFRYKIWTGF